MMDDEDKKSTDNQPSDSKEDLSEKDLDVEHLDLGSQPSSSLPRLDRRFLHTYSPTVSPAILPQRIVSTSGTTATMPSPVAPQPGEMPGPSGAMPSQAGSVPPRRSTFPGDQTVAGSDPRLQGTRYLDLQHQARQDSRIGRQRRLNSLARLPRDAHGNPVEIESLSHPEDSSHPTPGTQRSAREITRMQEVRQWIMENPEKFRTWDAIQYAQERRRWEFLMRWPRDLATGEPVPIAITTSSTRVELLPQYRGMRQNEIDWHGELSDARIRQQVDFIMSCTRGPLPPPLPPNPTPIQIAAHEIASRNAEMPQASAGQLLTEEQQQWFNELQRVESPMRAAWASMRDAMAQLPAHLSAHQRIQQVRTSWMARYQRELDSRASRDPRLDEPSIWRTTTLSGYNSAWRARLPQSDLTPEQLAERELVREEIAAATARGSRLHQAADRDSLYKLVKVTVGGGEKTREVSDFTHRQQWAVRWDRIIEQQVQRWRSEREDRERRRSAVSAADALVRDAREAMNRYSRLRPHAAVIQQRLSAQQPSIDLGSLSSVRVVERLAMPRGISGFEFALGFPRTQTGEPRALVRELASEEEVRWHAEINNKDTLQMLDFLLNLPRDANGRPAPVDPQTVPNRARSLWTRLMTPNSNERSIWMHLQQLADPQITDPSLRLQSMRDRWYIEYQQTALQRRSTRLEYLGITQQSLRADEQTLEEDLMHGVEVSATVQHLQARTERAFHLEMRVLARAAAQMDFLAERTTGNQQEVLQYFAAEIRAISNDLAEQYEANIASGLTSLARMTSEARTFDEWRSEEAARNSQMATLQLKLTEYEDEYTEAIQLVDRALDAVVPHLLSDEERNEIKKRVAEDEKNGVDIHNGKELATLTENTSLSVDDQEELRRRMQVLTQLRTEAYPLQRTQSNMFTNAWIRSDAMFLEGRENALQTEIARMEAERMSLLGLEAYTLRRWANVESELASASVELEQLESLAAHAPIPQGDVSGPDTESRKNELQDSIRNLKHQLKNLANQQMRQTVSWDRLYDLIAHLYTSRLERDAIQAYRSDLDSNAQDTDKRARALDQRAADLLERFNMKRPANLPSSAGALQTRFERQRRTLNELEADITHHQGILQRFTATLTAMEQALQERPIQPDEAHLVLRSREQQSAFMQRLALRRRIVELDRNYERRLERLRGSWTLNEREQLQSQAEVYEQLADLLTDYYQKTHLNQETNRQRLTALESLAPADMSQLNRDLTSSESEAKTDERQIDSLLRQDEREREVRPALWARVKEMRLSHQEWTERYRRLTTTVGSDLLTHWESNTSQSDEVRSSTSQSGRARSRLAPQTEQTELTSLSRDLADFDAGVAALDTLRPVDQLAEDTARLESIESRVGERVQLLERQAHLLNRARSERRILASRDARWPEILRTATPHGLLWQSLRERQLADARSLRRIDDVLRGLEGAPGENPRLRTPVMLTAMEEALRAEGRLRESALQSAQGIQRDIDRFNAAVNERQVLLSRRRALQGPLLSVQDLVEEAREMERLQFESAHLHSILESARSIADELRQSDSNPSADVLKKPAIFQHQRGLISANRNLLEQQNTALSIDTYLLDMDAMHRRLPDAFRGDALGTSIEESIRAQRQAIQELQNVPAPGGRLMHLRTQIPLLSSLTDDGAYLNEPMKTNYAHAAVIRQRFNEAGGVLQDMRQQADMLHGNLAWQQLRQNVDGTRSLQQYPRLLDEFRRQQLETRDQLRRLDLIRRAVTSPSEAEEINRIRTMLHRQSIMLLGATSSGANLLEDLQSSDADRWRQAEETLRSFNEERQTQINEPLNRLFELVVPALNERIRSRDATAVALIDRLDNLRRAGAGEGTAIRRFRRSLNIRRNQLANFQAQVAANAALTEPVQVDHLAHVARNLDYMERGQAHPMVRAAEIELRSLRAAIDRERAVLQSVHPDLQAFSQIALRQLNEQDIRLQQVESRIQEARNDPSQQIRVAVDWHNRVSREIREFETRRDLPQRLARQSTLQRQIETQLVDIDSQQRIWNSLPSSLREPEIATGIGEQRNRLDDFSLRLRGVLGLPAANQQTIQRDLRNGIHREGDLLLQRRIRLQYLLRQAHLIEEVDREFAEIAAWRARIRGMETVLGHQRAPDSLTSLIQDVTARFDRLTAMRNQLARPLSSQGFFNPLDEIQNRLRTLRTFHPPQMPLGQALNNVEKDVIRSQEEALEARLSYQSNLIELNFGSAPAGRPGEVLNTVRELISDLQDQATVLSAQERLQILERAMRFLQVDQLRSLQEENRERMTTRVTRIDRGVHDFDTPVPPARPAPTAVDKQAPLKVGSEDVRAAESTSAPEPPPRRPAKLRAWLSRLKRDERGKVRATQQPAGQPDVERPKTSYRLLRGLSFGGGTTAQGREKKMADETPEAGRSASRSGTETQPSGPLESVQRTLTQVTSFFGGDPTPRLPAHAMERYRHYHGISATPPAPVLYTDPNLTILQARVLGFDRSFIYVENPASADPHAPSSSSAPSIQGIVAIPRGTRTGIPDSAIKGHMKEDVTEIRIKAAKQQEKPGKDVDSSPKKPRKGPTL